MPKPKPEPIDPSVAIAEKTAGWTVTNWKGIAAVGTLLAGVVVWGWGKYTASAVEAARVVQTQAAGDTLAVRQELKDFRNEMAIRLTTIESNQSEQKDLLNRILLQNLRVTARGDVP